MNVFAPCNPVSDPGRRNNARAPLGIPGRLILLDGNCPCEVEDISREGACIAADCELGPGDHGALQCNGLDHFFTVQWASGYRFGLNFDEVVPKDVILYLRHLAAAGEDGTTRSMREFGREWVEGSAGHSID